MSDAVHPNTVSHISRFIPGTAIDVQVVEHKSARFKTKLIGVETGQYLILKMPDIKKQPFLKDALKETNQLILRFLAENDSGECVAFQSKVKWVVGYPVKMLFISFPQQVQSRQLRSETRSQTRLPAKINAEVESNGEEGQMISVSVGGIIVDISQGGCRFVFEAPQSTTGLKSKDIRVEFSLGKESVAVEGEVCNQRAQDCVFSLGIKFISIPDILEKQLKTLLI